MRKRKNYTNTQLMSALEDMRKNKISAEKASKKYNIPVRTLRYRQKHVMKGYPNRCLTTKQEESLVNYIKYCAERAFPLTRKMIKAFVREIIDKEGNSLINVNTVSGPSDKWFRGFLKRHPDIALRTPDSIDRGRYGMANSTVMRDHFQLLEKCLTDLGIRDKPSQIFNVDETGFGKCEKREKVVTEKVRKHTYARSVSSTSHITATICVAANGLVLPTFLIYENSFPSGSYRDGAPRDWLFGTSPNGYMDGDLFYKWFETVFLPNCSKRPSLLILDNHESHITLKLIQRAKAEEVELYGLPPHTTHVTQPLDVALFKPLKTKFSDIAINLGYARKDLVIGKAKFAPVLSSAIDQTFSPHHIKEAFRKTGIYPFNPQVISQMQLAPADKHQVSHHDEVHDDQTSCAPPALCHACGHFVQQNPLVEQGLIPYNLSELFLPIFIKPPEKKRRIVTKSRVLTGEEILSQLEQKEEEAERKKKKQKERKERAEMRRKEVEEKKNKKRKATTKKATKRKQKDSEDTNSNDDIPIPPPFDCEQDILPALSRPKRHSKKPKRYLDEDCELAAIIDDVEENDLVICTFCTSREAPSTSTCDREIDGWFLCEHCNRWFHNVCQGFDNNEAFSSTAAICQECRVFLEE